MDPDERTIEGEIAPVPPRRIRVWDFLAVGLVLAGAAGWGVPLVLAKISDWRIRTMAQRIQDLRGGLYRYHAEVGTLLALDGAGAGQVVPPAPLDKVGSLGWVLTRTIAPYAGEGWERFRGPYVPVDRWDPPLIGDHLSMAAVPTSGAVRQVPLPLFRSAATGTSLLQSGHVVAWAVITGVPEADFERLDAILDPGAKTASQRERSGELLWSPDDGGTMVVMLAQK